MLTLKHNIVSRQEHHRLQQTDHLPQEQLIRLTEQRHFCNHIPVHKQSKVNAQLSRQLFEELHFADIAPRFPQIRKIVAHLKLQRRRDGVPPHVLKHLSRLPFVLRFSSIQISHQRGYIANYKSVHANSEKLNNHGVDQLQMVAMIRRNVPVSDGRNRRDAPIQCPQVARKEFTLGLPGSNCQPPQRNEMGHKDQPVRKNHKPQGRAADFHKLRQPSKKTVYLKQAKQPHQAQAAQPRQQRPLRRGVIAGQQHKHRKRESR